MSRFSGPQTVTGENARTARERRRQEAAARDAALPASSLQRAQNKREVLAKAARLNKTTRRAR